MSFLDYFYYQMIKENLCFLETFIKNPLCNASITPSSSYLAKWMIKDIDFSKKLNILELWAGTWPMTEEIVKVKTKDSNYIIIDLEKKYVDILNKKYWNKAKIVEWNALDFQEICKKNWMEKIDLIISSLPFISKDVNEIFVKKIKEQISKWTTFRMFTYAPYFMKKHYKELPLKKKEFILLNVPPAWVYWN